MNLIVTDAAKFADPHTTAAGEPRARVVLRALETLWLNTGTLCNLTCKRCYIESSPSNDRLAYLTREDVAGYLDEIRRLGLPVAQIGITGGEPFMNPDILDIVGDCLDAGHEVLLLTNAMRPMMKCADGLLELRERYPDALTLRVSIDHYDRAQHESERGSRSWAPMIDGLRWLGRHSFRVHVAGRTCWDESEASLRQGFVALLEQLGVHIDPQDHAALLLFPEMDPTADVPEITTACFGMLGVDPAELMCASARMVLRRRGARAPEVVACTLLPYEPGFSFGASLAESLSEVALNHPHCARFCVLGGGSCST